MQCVYNYVSRNKIPYNCMYMSKHIPKFYIIHSVFKQGNLDKIINDGVIKAGATLPSKYLSMSDPKDPLKHIFTTLYFEDLHNLTFFWQPSIVLHPKLLYERGGTFKKSWSGDAKHPDDIVIEKYDKHFSEKILQIYKFIKNPVGISELAKKDPYTTHELMLNTNISLNKYAIMVVCGVCNDRRFVKLNNTVKKKYDIHVMQNNYPMPIIKDILNKK